MAADGCAPGTFSTIHSPDGNATSYLFNDFHAASDGVTAPRRARCDLAAPVKSPRGFSVFAVDYRGFVVKSASQSTSVTTNRHGATDTVYDPDGDVVTDFAVTRHLSSADMRRLMLSIRLAADGGPGDPAPAEIVLDTVDIARIGFTTMASVRTSLDEIAAQRRDLIRRLDRLSGSILGVSEAFSADDYVSVFSGTDTPLGVSARWNATDALTIRAGLAAVNSSGSTDADGNLLFAASARYAMQLDKAWALYGELGGWAAGGVRADYQRTYLNGDDPVTISSNASGDAAGIYARMGIVHAPDPNNELGLSIGIKRAILDIGAYRERSGADNLFAARIGGRPSYLDTVDIALAWTHALTRTIDLTTTLSIGREFADKQAVAADIDWVGNSKGGWQGAWFAGAGARLGWRFQENWSIETTLSVDTAQRMTPSWNAGLRLKANF